MATPSVKRTATELDDDPCLKELYDRLLAIRQTPGKDKATLFRALAAKAMASANELEEPGVTGLLKAWKNGKS